MRMPRIQMKMLYLCCNLHDIIIIGICIYGYRLLLSCQGKPPHVHILSHYGDVRLNDRSAYRMGELYHQLCYQNPKYFFHALSVLVNTLLCSIVRI